MKRSIIKTNKEDLKIELEKIKEKFKETHDIISDSKKIKDLLPILIGKKVKIEKTDKPNRNFYTFHIGKLILLNKYNRNKTVDYSVETNSSVIDFKSDGVEKITKDKNKLSSIVIHLK